MTQSPAAPPEPSTQDRIIEATADLVCAYKLNIAFYESAGARGYENVHRTLAMIPKGIVTIGDGKRGDGNSIDRGGDRRPVERRPLHGGGGHRAGKSGEHRERPSVVERLERREGGFLVTRAERARPVRLGLDLRGARGKVGGALGTVGHDGDPPSGKRIQTELTHNVVSLRPTGAGSADGPREFTRVSRTRSRGVATRS